MKKLALFLVVAAMSVTSVNAQLGGSKSNLLFADASLPVDARYGVKSGIIKFEATVQGGQAIVTQHFDEYGKKIESLTVLEQKMAESTIPSLQFDNNTVRTEIKSMQFGDTIYIINLAQKIGQKTVSSELIVNWLNLSNEAIEKYNLKELGEETVAGKPCKKYSSEVSQMGQTVYSEIWVWKGIELKTIAKLGDIEITNKTAIEVQENVEIDPKVFEVPEGMTMM